jgi:hypothetical protein
MYILFSFFFHATIPIIFAYRSAWGCDTYFELRDSLLELLS